MVNVVPGPPYLVESVARAKGSVAMPSPSNPKIPAPVSDKLTRVWPELLKTLMATSSISSYGPWKGAETVITPPGPTMRSKEALVGTTGLPVVVKRYGSAALWGSEFGSNVPPLYPWPMPHGWATKPALADPHMKTPKASASASD